MRYINSGFSATFETKVRLSMTRERLDGLCLVLLGCAVFILVGFALENAARHPTADFRVVYDSARCLVEHRDPYDVSQLHHIYQEQGAETPLDTPADRLTQSRLIYLPTAFALTVPFALLPFWPAHLLWLLITAGGLILASLLMWDAGAKSSSIVAGGLVCLSLANSELFLILGNPAGIAISLCAVAAWCFLQERFATMGVLCLAISLMLKPHDTGLVWIYFLIAGKANRRRALQAMVMVACFSLPAVLWLTHVAPDWMHELHLNLVANSAHGDLSDPGPASMASHGIGMVVSLQSVFSLFRDDPHFYNPATYLVCGVLLLGWLLKTMRTRLSPETAWFALAPISALSILPVYHRIYDARLLLLAIPACVMLWKDRGLRAWIALLLSTAGILLTGGIPWAIFLSVLRYLHVGATGFTGQLLIAAQVVPVPLLLLAVGVFYLWVFVRHASDKGSFDAERTSHSKSLEIAPIRPE
jgi:hypothetical protein